MNFEIRFNRNENIRQLQYYDTGLDKSTLDKFPNLKIMTLINVKLDKHLEFKLNSKYFDNWSGDFSNLQYKNGMDDWELITMGIKDSILHGVSDDLKPERILLVDNCDFNTDTGLWKFRNIFTRVKYLLIECWDPRKIVERISTLQFFFVE